MVFAYLNCIGSYFGASLGAIAVLVLGKRARLSPPESKAKLYTLVSLCAVAGIGFYAVVLARVAFAIPIIQTVLSAVAVVLIIDVIEDLMSLLMREIALALVLIVCAYALIDNVIAPCIQETGSIVFLAVCHMALLAVFVILRVGIAEHAVAPTGEKRRRDTAADADAANMQDAHQPWQLHLHAFAYFFVFGFMHAETSVITPSALAVNIPYFCSVMTAAVLFYVIFVVRENSDSPWPYLRILVFPLGFLGYLTLPLLRAPMSTGSGFGFFIPIFFSEISFVFYDMFFILFLSYAIKESERPASAILHQSMCVKFIGTCVGVICGCAVVGYLEFDLGLTVFISFCAFLILVAATFWVGDDRTVRKVWGLRREKEPRKMRNEELDRKVEQLSGVYYLTNREREVVRGIVDGKHASQIADEMFVSVSTVRSHIKSVHSKLDVHSEKELIAMVNQFRG